MTESDLNESDIKICKTGIEDLDEILGGGFLSGSTVLLSGSSGTGKSILCSEFLFRGFKQFNEKGVLVSLTESKEKTVQHLRSFKFFNKNLFSDGSIMILDLKVASVLKDLLLSDPMSISKTIIETVRQSEAERVVIDSVTAVCQNLTGPEQIREFIFNLGTGLSALDCTTILISEIEPGKSVYSPYGIEEFISDSVIIVGDIERRGDLMRTLRVVKVRGQEHSRRRFELRITKEGIRIFPIIPTIGRMRIATEESGE